MPNPTPIMIQPIRPKCKYCDEPCKEKSKRSARGFIIYHNTCNSHNANSLRRFLKEYCEFCGFKPVHRCQLDIDHKDGNKRNCSEDNLQTLCANCHRLKTYLSKDWYRKDQKPKDYI